MYAPTIEVTPDIGEVIKCLRQSCDVGSVMIKGNNNNKTSIEARASQYLPYYSSRLFSLADTPLHLP
jgi:hypothetical protein